MNVAHSGDDLMEVPENHLDKNVNSIFIYMTKVNLTVIVIYMATVLSLVIDPDSLPLTHMVVSCWVYILHTDDSHDNAGPPMIQHHQVYSNFISF